MDDLDAFARLSDRIAELERRVFVLEHPSGATSVTSAQPATPVTAAASTETLPLAQDGGIFPVLGKAMLGIAGAYLLRAVAESGSFPKLAVVILALAYAGMWLVWAARVPDAARFASTVYAATAALILAPMLWELTLRFEVLPTSATAAVLVTFVVAAYCLSWKRSLIAVVWVANAAAVLTTLALLVATYDLVPFVSALILIALTCEVAACRSRWLALRPFVAVAADLGTWVLLYIYSRTEGVPSEYKNVTALPLLALGCILFLIYGTNTLFRTTRLHQKISIFEITQSIVTFLLGAFSLLHFGASGGAKALEALCLASSAACYATAYAWFDRVAEQRNYHVFATWSAALFLAGISLCLPPLLLALCLSAVAIVVTILGVRSSRLTLEFHGLVYLAAAAYVSGLLHYAGGALAGTFPAVPGWIVWMVAASAVTCYAVGSRSGVGPWNQRFLQLLSAILAVAAAITFLVSVLVWLAAIGMSLGAQQVAVIRTLITCGVALALAFGGSRWQRAELGWIAYGALALVTAKLLFEDLQHGHPASTAMSIFLYALALILVPRMARIARR